MLILYVYYTFYFIILNLINNYDLSKCTQVHCGSWFFGLLQLTLSCHIHVFPHRFSPHWVHGVASFAATAKPAWVPPGTAAAIAATCSAWANSAFAASWRCNTLHYITSYHVSAIISYCIISFDIVSFDIDSIPSICIYINILYILYQLVLCTPYYITHIISNHFPKSSFEIQFICRDNSFQKKTMVSSSKKKKGTEFQGYHQFNTLRMTSSQTLGTARNYGLSPNLLHLDCLLQAICLSSVLHRF